MRIDISARWRTRPSIRIATIGRIRYARVANFLRIEWRVGSAMPFKLMH
jgi:hypothetical protein